MDQVKKSLFHTSLTSFSGIKTNTHRKGSHLSPTLPVLSVLTIGPIISKLSRSAVAPLWKDQGSQLHMASISYCFHFKGQNAHFKVSKESLSTRQFIPVSGQRQRNIRRSRNALPWCNRKSNLKTKSCKKKKEKEILQIVHFQFKLQKQ